MRNTIIIDQHITVAATAETVFAFACDYRNDPDWRSGVRAMSTDSQGATRAGDHTHEVMRVLGRTTRTEAIITAHEPNRYTAFRTTAGDLTANGSRRTQSTSDGSIFTYHAEAVLDPPLRPLAGLIEWIFNRRAARDLRTLAELLNQPAPRRNLASISGESGHLGSERNNR